MSFNLYTYPLREVFPFYRQGNSLTELKWCVPVAQWVSQPAGTGTGVPCPNHMLSALAPLLRWVWSANWGRSVSCWLPVHNKLTLAIRKLPQQFDRVILCLSNPIILNGLHWCLLFHFSRHSFLLCFSEVSVCHSVGAGWIKSLAIATPSLRSWNPGRTVFLV